MTIARARQKGFTIVELLVVIVVIAILAAITVTTYAGVQERARDARRSQDMRTIKQMLLLYSIENGGVPKTSTYAGAGPGGWNISTMPSWLSFLNANYGKAPVDPVNTGTTDPNTSYSLAYFYYCYDNGSSGYSGPTVAIGYWSEQTKTQQKSFFNIDKCL